MRVMRIVPGAVAVALGGAGQAAAQQPEAPAAPADILTSAVLEHAADARSARARLQSLLERPDVHAIAEANAIDMQGVQDAAGTMSGTQLQLVLPHLQAAEDALAGGQSLTISTTTIILVLLIVILIVLIA